MRASTAEAASRTLAQARKQWLLSAGAGVSPDFQRCCGSERSGSETRRVIDRGRVPRKQVRRFVPAEQLSLRRRKQKARKQLAPFRAGHDFNPRRGRRSQRRTRASGASASARLGRQPGVGRYGDRLDRRMLDVGWIIATSAGRNRRKKNDGQTCPRHAGW